jgi:hypothetical protein
MSQILNWCRAIQLRDYYDDTYRPEVALDIPTKVTKRPQSSLLIALKEIFVDESRVSFTDLVARPQLRQLVEVQVPNPSRIQIEHLIASEMRKLLKDGFIYMLDEANQVYEHTTLHNLGTTIKRMVTNEFMSLREQYDGVYVEEIMVLLQATPFKTIPRNHVQKIVNTMISNNQLLKEGNKIRLF